MPPVVDLWRVFRRALGPGAVATVVVLAAAALVAVDVAARPVAGGFGLFALHVVVCRFAR